MSADNWTECPLCRADDELREDYEICIEEMAVVTRYGCRCMKCNFQFIFKHEEPFTFTKSELETSKIAVEKRNAIDQLELRKQDLERQKQGIEKQLHELLDQTPDSPAGRKGEE